MRLFSTLIAALLLAVAGTTSAGPITTDQWYTFGFGGDGSALVSGSGFVTGAESLDLDDPPWTIVLGGDAILTVVDGFNSGDIFEMFDGGGSIGSTSAPILGANCSNSEVGCLADASFSRGAFALGAGAHSLTGVVTSSPFGGGAGFLRIDLADVPEAGTLSLLGLGLLGLGFAGRRRRS